MIKRSQVLGIALATALSASVGSVAYAAGDMTPEETAAELQQAFSLDPEITQVVEATVRDGKIVLIGSVVDQQAYDRVNAIVEEMDIDSGMVDNQVMTN